MKKPNLLLYALLLVFALPRGAAAESIKLPLGEESPEVYFDGTTFGTVDDGNASTLGDQNTRIIFAGFGGMFADILDSTASFSLDGVTAVGPASEPIPGLVAQQTLGGTFSLYAPDNTLLLSGEVTNGALGGGTESATGSFFNTTVGTFTGGALLSFFQLNTLQIVLAMQDIHSGQLVGMHITNGALDPFTSDAASLIGGDAAAVPEPTSMLLLLSGCSAAAAYRRRQRAS